MTRSRLLAFVLGGALAAAGISAVATTSLGVTGAAAGTTTTSDGPQPATAAVERRDLADRRRLAGQLGFGASSTVGLRSGTGTITWLPEVGMELGAGDPVARVDEVTVPLLIGTLPVFRALTDGVTRGEDVRQLEAQLVALGYATSSATFPDDRFTSATRTALRSWQKAAAMTVDGRLDPNDVVVAPAPVRVAARVAAVGDPAAADLLRVTATTRVVTIDATPQEARDIAVGAPVTVRAPDGRSAQGSVVDIATTFGSEDGPGGPTYKRAITAVLDATDDLGDLTLSPVEVEVTLVAATDVLAVPVHALLATTAGYIVERIADGDVTPVPVDVGLVVEGWAQIIGDLAPGDLVVVPR